MSYRSVGLLVIVVVLMSIAVMPVCAQTPAPEASEAVTTTVGTEETVPATKVAEVVANEPYNIGYVVKTLDNPYWITFDEYAKKAAEALGVTFSAYSTGGESQIENQVRIVEDLVAQQVDAIILCPVDTDGIVPGIKTANAANIPVLLANDSASGGEFVTVVATDNTKAAELAGQFAVDTLGGKGKVAILEGISGQLAARQRLQGFRNIVDSYPDIEIVSSQPAKWDRALALTTAENILTANPELDMIYACNDMMALGAYEAVKNAGRDVLVVGFDGSDEALESIANGGMAATVRQYPERMAVLGVAEMVLVLNGEEIPPTIDTGAVLVDANNVQELLTTPPTVEDLLKDAVVVAAAQ